MLITLHLINKMPTSRFGGNSLHEMLYGKKSTYNYKRVFKCLCYIRNNPCEKNKFGPRERMCIFLSYPYGKKRWRVHDLETKEIFVSRDLILEESIFPFPQVVRVQSWPTSQKRLIFDNDILVFGGIASRMTESWLERLR